MADMRLPKGLIVDMVTPLSRDGEIDGAGLERHVKGLMDHAQALFIAGPSMGEGEALGPEQREDLFHRILLIVQSRLPVLIWISGQTAEETEGTLLLLKKRLKALYYEGPVFWVDTPLYYHSNRGMEDHYKNISSLAERPFILINDPEFIRRKGQPLKRPNIRTSILKGLAEIEAVKGLIYSGTLDRSYNYRKAVRSHPDFMIYEGDESRFLERPGLNGVLSRGANLNPAAWRTITASSLNLDGDHGDYPDRMGQILDAGRHLNELKHIYRGYGPGFFKQVLAETGVIEHAVSTVESKNMADDVEKIIMLMKDYRSNFPFNR